MSTEKTIQVGVGAVIIRDGKILLTKRKGSHGEGMYGSFGGHLEFGESVFDGIRREAREELGIEIKNIRFVSCTGMRKYGKHYIDISCTADIASGEPRVMELDKIESVEWYALEDLPEPLFEPVRIVLKALKSGEHFFEV